jgi:hypothetical protein
MTRIGCGHRVVKFQSSYSNEQISKRNTKALGSILAIDSPCADPRIP